jgi:Zn-dependent protease with chaperone function
MPDPLDETRLARADIRIAKRMNQRLVDALALEAGPRRRGIEWLVVVTLATLVHAVTLAFLAAGVACLTLGANWPVRAAGIVCLLVVVAVAGPLQLRQSRRERADRRRRRGPGLMDAATCPATRALIVELAAVVGSPVPDRVEVDRDFNAYAMRLGRRRAMAFGAPLWVLEEREGRIATLAHELGHFAHGDLLHGRYVWGAWSSLTRWIDILDTDRQAEFGAIIWAMLWPLRALLTGYRRLLELAAGPSHRRQEHYADLASAVAAGTRGAVRSLELFLFSEGVDVTIHRAAINREDVGAALAAFGSGLTDERRAATRGRVDIRKSRIDDSHPPTIERVRLLESREPVGPAIIRTDAEWSLIDAEWAAAVESQLGRLAERHRYVH